MLSFAIVSLILAAALVSPAETPSPAPDASPQSPLAQQLINLEKALPAAQQKKDMDFYKRTLTDDFIAVGTDAKVHSRVEILEDLPAIDASPVRAYDEQAEKSMIA